MTQIVYGAVGAVIGYWVGGPTGAQYGWAIGSTIGAVASAPDQKGPRLGDTAVQLSSYGAALGIGYGSFRRAGNIFWSTPLRETASEEGKGGPTVTTFSYSVSCAIAVCEGEHQSVRRIWADAKLIFDTSEDADISTQAGTSAIRQYITWHSGSETQMPDSTIETYKGAGNVPGYRGTAYIVFTDLPLSDYGNRIPNFSFELSDEPTIEATTGDMQPDMLYAWTDTGAGPRHSHGDSEFAIGGTPYETYEDAYAAMLAASGGLATEYIGYWTDVNGILSRFDADEGAQTDINTGNGGYGALDVFLAFGFNQPDIILYNGIDNIRGEGLGCDEATAANLTADDGLCALVSNYGTYDGSGLSSGHPPLLRLLKTTSDYEPGYDDQINYCPSFGLQSDGFVPKANIQENSIIRVRRVLTILPQRCEPGEPTFEQPAQLPGSPTLCLYIDGELTPNYQYTRTAGSYVQLRAHVLGSVVPLGPIVESTDPLATDAAYWDAAADEAGITGDYGVDYPQASSVAGVGEATYETCVASTAVLADIVSSVSVRAGLAEDEIDVDALDDIVLGYQIGRQTTGRSAIEPLRSAFWFDGVESGDVIRFVKRGGAPVATLTYDDLGAGEETCGQPSEPLRAQESELPAVVYVAYPAIAADYQTGTQRARRRVTSSQQEVGVEMPVVLTDASAADIADVLLYDAWTGRTRRKIAVTRAWSHLEPTDVIAWNDGEFDYISGIFDKEEDGPVIRLELRDQDAAAYSPNAAGGVTAGGGSAVRIDGPTRAILMDIPLLRDADDSAGFYLGASGYLLTWRGGQLFKSTDDGATYSASQVLARTATIGATLSVLGDYDGGNTVDEINSLTVVCYTGSLESITRAQLLDNGNYALAGDELFQFQRATLTVANTYRLTGLLRGRRGTEQYMATHAIGERFVLLTEATLYRIADTLANLNVANIYKAVTVGQALDDAAEIPFTDTGASLKPLSPVHLAVTAQVGGGYLAEWVRRTRLSSAWLDGVDVPLGETTESYEVDVVSSGSVVATYSTDTTSAELDGSFSTELTPGMQLGSGTWGLVEAGGLWFGMLDVRTVVETTNARVLQFSPTTGVVIASTIAIGTLTRRVVVNGSDLYVLFDSVTGQFINRYGVADLSAPAATHDFTGLSTPEGVEIASDGAALWLTCATGDLLKLDMTSLAVDDTFNLGADALGHAHVSGDNLWVCVPDASEVLLFDLVTEAVTLTVTCANPPSESIQQDDLLFVVEIGTVGISNAYRVAVFDAATAALVVRHEVGEGNYYGHDRLAAFDSGVLFSSNNDDVVLFDASTGEISRQYDAMPTWLAGVVGSTLFLTNADPGSSTLNQTFAYAGSGAPPDYSGMTVKVYQMSASVGRGFPAEITLD